jgi:uncharacterized membrane protein
VWRTFKFPVRIKDYEPLLEALKDRTGVEVEHKAGPEIIETFLESTERLLEYDALIVSELSKGILTQHFYPGTVPGPNKLRNVRDFVEAGGFCYRGGWMTYQGYEGAGNGQGTPVEDVLRIEIQSVFNDRVDRPEGAETSLLEIDHPALEQFDRGLLTDIYGYNRTGQVRDDAELHAPVDEDQLADERFLRSDDGETPRQVTRRPLGASWTVVASQGCRSANSRLHKSPGRSPPTNGDVRLPNDSATESTDS